VSLVAQQYDLFGIEVLPMLTLDNIAVMSRTALFERYMPRLLCLAYRSLDSEDAKNNMRSSQIRRSKSKN
jgi:hypothetical protein